MRKFRNSCLFVVGLASLSFGDEPLNASQLAQELERRAEDYFYNVAEPNRFEKLDQTLDQLEKIDPKLPYVHWAKARSVFFQKEMIYLKQVGRDSATQFNEEKIDLADRCHKHVDRCLDLAPKNAECHLLKASCYSMQASTWGVSFKSMKLCKKIDAELVSAIELPSYYLHFGEAKTGQLAMILRGILYRVMPDGWWFSFVAGVRGNRKKAYEWIRDVSKGSLRKEPMLLLEYGTAALCYGQVSKQHQIVEEGLSVLKEGLRLPTRAPLDDFDKANITYLLSTPEAACNYRRERFENLSDGAVSTSISKQKE